MPGLIREAAEADLEKLMEIWLTANVTVHDFIPGEYWITQYETVKRTLPRAAVYVYEEEGSIRGFAGMREEVLAGLFIDENFRSRGIGKALLDYLKERHGHLSLNVYRENSRAAHFYQREDFCIDSVHMDPETGRYDFLMKWYREM